jgi:transposase
LDDRCILNAILFVLKTGIPWNDLPHEMGFGCGGTCRNRLAQWQTTGAWEEIRLLILEKLPGAHLFDWSRTGGGGKLNGSRNP